MAAPLPPPRTNADDAAYWEAAGRNILLLRRCAACGRPHFPPRSQCPGCWSDRLEWIPASGRATVYTYTIMRRAPLPEFAPQLPYVVALVDLTEGVRMMANIVGAGALDVAVDDPVELCFEERGGARLPQFRRVADA